MMISELFVRVRADVADVNRKFRDIERSMGGVDKASTGGRLSLGRLGNQFAGLAGQIARVHPVVGNVAGVLGNFAIGAGLTVGVLAGLAAIAVAYDKITESSRKAMEASDKLIESYLKAAKIRALGVGGQQKSDIADINKGVTEHGKWAGFLSAAAGALAGTGLEGWLGAKAGGHAQKIQEASVAAQEAVNQLGLAIGAANDETARKSDEAARAAKTAAEKIAAAIVKAQQAFLAGAASTLTVFDNLASHGTESSVVNQKLIADYQKITEQIRQMGSVSGPAMVELLKLRDALAANLVVAQAIAREASTGTIGPLKGKTLPGVGVAANIPGADAPMSNKSSPSDPIVKVQSALERQMIKDAQNAQTVANAVLSSASIIVSALNIGGGGRGSQIGGALGGVLGAAAGTMAGAKIGSTFGSLIAPGIGTIIGGMAGSLLGGLFDKKDKTTDRNTDAIKLLTQALTLNAPSGFKVEPFRYGASVAASRSGNTVVNIDARGSDAKEIARLVSRYATRGGAPLFSGA